MEKLKTQNDELYEENKALHAEVHCLGALKLELQRKLFLAGVQPQWEDSSRGRGGSLGDILQSF